MTLQCRMQCSFMCALQQKEIVCLHKLKHALVASQRKFTNRAWHRSFASAGQPSVPDLVLRSSRLVRIAVGLLQQVCKVVVARQLRHIHCLSLAPHLFYPPIPTGCCLAPIADRVCALLQGPKHVLHQNDASQHNCALLMVLSMPCVRQKLKIISSSAVLP